MAITNSPKIKNAETWGTISTTWATETRTWAECISLITNTVPGSNYHWDTWETTWDELTIYTWDELVFGLMTNQAMSLTAPLWYYRTFPWELSLPWQVTFTGIITNVAKP